MHDDPRRAAHFRLTALDGAESFNVGGPKDVPLFSLHAFSSDYGVDPQMRVLVNGKEDLVGISGTVRDALNLNRPGTVAPKNLIVCRLFEGRLIPEKFDPANNDILQLVLMPRDEIAR
jgi:hypothetical protein